MGSGRRVFKSRRPDHLLPQKEELRNELCCSFLLETLILPLRIAYAIAASRLNHSNLWGVAPRTTPLRP
jgi:hypothetical protein